jgi:antirestriction protein
MAQSYLAAYYCPMGCCEVVYAKCTKSNRVFAICTACGCAWFEPQNETWELGDLGNCLTNYHEYAPQGFSVASLTEIREAGFESAIVNVQVGSRSADDFDWFNRKYYGR